MILAYHGKSVNMEELRRVTGVSRDCMNAADMVRAARHYGLIAKAYSRGDPEDLRPLPLPFVAHVNFIHFAVVEGFTDTHVLLNDPAVGRVDVALEDFHRRFTGIVICFEPGPDFQYDPRPPSPFRNYLRRIGKGAPDAPRYLALAFASSLILAMLLLAYIGIAARLPEAGASVHRWLAWLGTAALAYGAVSALQGWSLGRLETIMAQSQTADVARQLRSVPFSFFAYRLPSRLRTTIDTQAEVARFFCQDFLSAVLRMPVIAVLLLAAWWLEPVMGIALTLICIVTLILFPLLYRWRSGYARMEDAQTDPHLASIATTLENIEGIKLAGMAGEHIAGSMGVLATRRLAHQRAGLAGCADAALSQVLHLAMPFAVLASGVLVAWESPMTNGIWLAGFLLSAALAAELQRWSGLPRKLDIASHQLLHIDDLFRQPEQAAPETSLTLDQSLPPGAMELRDVVFGYAAMKPPLLQGVSLRLAPGEQLGITGPSGSGKSTLGGLLSGLHLPLAGQIKVSPGGTARGIAVAWVDKNAFFFEGSVRDNLLLGQNDVDSEDIVRALNDACIDDVLVDRPGGLDGPVEARGRNFSGGQLQRLEIARALIRNPRILILDEATDALEPSLEARIRSNLRRRQCSLVIISHRSSTLAACDRVIHMHAGRILDSPDLPVPAAAQPPAPPRMTVDAYANQIDDLDSDWIASTRLDAGQQQALREVFLAVAQATGQRLLAPPPSGPLPCQAGALVAFLARHHGLIARRVRLDEARLWRMDHGPLIAFTQTDAHPVALVPHGHRYRVQGDAPDTSQDIAAPNLRPEAFCLYPAMDDAPASPWGMLHRALGSATTDLRRACAISAAIWVLAALPVAILLGLVTDLERTQAGGWSLLPILLALLTAAGLLEFARHLAFLRLESHVESRMLLSLHQRVARLPPAFVRGFTPEQWGASLDGFVRLLDQIRPSSLRTMLDGGLMVSMTLLLTVFQPSLLPLALFLLLSALVIPFVGARLSGSLRERQFAARTNARRLLLDVLRGVARLRLLQADTALLQRWQALDLAEKKQGQRLRQRDHVDAWLADAYPWLAHALWLGALVAQGASPLVWLASTLTLMIGLRGAHHLGKAWADHGRAHGFIQEAGRLSGAAPEQGQSLAHPPDTRAAPIAMRDVRFHYPGTQTPALHEVSLRIEPGQFVVIAGPSGGGKSTLLRLLLGFETPDAGEVRIGPHRLTELDLVRWRDHVGAVRQNEQLEAAGTLRSQIAGLTPFSLDDVWEVARQVVLADDIQAMPMGMQTIVEGNKISTGQEQRLLIARQLIRRPSLLILDEATNAIPEQVQVSLFANLRALGITCILVSHRESTLALADRIFFIEAGRLVWEGPPAALAGEQRLLDLMRAERAIEELSP